MYNVVHYRRDLTVFECTFTVIGQRCKQR